MYVRTYAPVDFVVGAEALSVKVLLSTCRLRFVSYRHFR